MTEERPACLACASDAIEGNQSVFLPRRALESPIYLSIHRPLLAQHNMEHVDRFRIVA